MAVLLLLAAVVLAVALIVAYAREIRTEYYTWAHREDVRTMTCVQREKKVALALLTYAIDHGERLPDMKSWPVAIVPYVEKGDLEAYACPCDRHPERIAGIAWGPGQGLSYAAPEGFRVRSLKDVQLPPSVPLIFESATVPVASFADVAYRHRMRLEPGDLANVAFMDGHVQWMSRASISQLPGAK
jgi:prepilin-type processing-associated H-X9-DG protein